jgi:excisionase family DNA binding protein
VIDPTYLTPRQVADRLGLARTDAILTWIASGHLHAVNVSTGPGRPTWRIASADLDSFLAARRSAPAQTARRSRRPKTPDVIRFF